METPTKCPESPQPGPSEAGKHSPHSKQWDKFQFPLTPSRTLSLFVVVVVVFCRVSIQIHSRMSLGKGRGSIQSRLVLGTCTIWRNCLQVNFGRESSIYYFMPIHNWAHIQLKSDTWEGKCSVENWLCARICQWKQRTTLTTPISKPTSFFHRGSPKQAHLCSSGLVISRVYPDFFCGFALNIILSNESSMHCNQWGLLSHSQARS